MGLDYDGDRHYLCKLRTLGILEDVETHRLPKRIRQGAQMVSCADSAQFDDIYQQHMRLSGCKKCAPLNHYGGALVIPRGSPANFRGQGEIAKDQLFLGYAIGKGDVQVHMSHYPCGVADAYEIPAQKCLQLLCDARDQVIEFFEMRLANIKTYLAAAEIVGHSNVDRICLESGLPLMEALAIQRVIKYCKSIERVRSIVMPTEDLVLSHYHIDWGDRKRTYHLNRNTFRELVQRGD